MRLPFMGENKIDLATWFPSVQKLTKLQKQIKSEVKVWTSPTQFPTTLYLVFNEIVVSI